MRSLSLAENKKSMIMCLFIVFAGFLVYANSFKNEFVFDDQIQIVRNENIKSFENFGKVFVSHLTEGVDAKGKFYRPIQSITLMIDDFLWGEDVFGYHLTNTILHIIVSILVFRLLFMISGSDSLAFLSSLIYLVHPIHTEAVTYISGRADSLNTIFVLTTLIFQTSVWRSRSLSIKALFYLGALLSFMCALFSKESAVMIPLLMIFNEYVLRSDKGYTIFKGKNLIFYIPFILILWGWFILKNGIVSTELMIGKDLPYAQRLILLPRLLIDYLKISFVPVNLHMEYKFPFAPDSIMREFYFLPFILLLPVIFFVYHFWRDGRNNKIYRTLFWGFGFFFITLLPFTNTFFLLNAVFAEHWLYIPEIGLIFAAMSTLCFKLYGSFKPKRSVWIVAIIVISIFSILSIKQNRVWKNGLTLYSHILKFAPYSEKVHNNIAGLYIRDGDLEKAEKHLLIAVDLAPEFDLARKNLAYVRSLRLRKE